MLWVIRWRGGLGALGSVGREEMLVVLRREAVGGRVEVRVFDSCERS